MWPCSVKSSRRLPQLSRLFCLGWSSARPKKSRLKLKLVGLLCALILLVNGCVSSTAGPTRTLPVRPELTSLTATGDGGIMMNKRDAAELLIYIEALEAACGVNQ